MIVEAICESCGKTYFKRDRGRKHPVGARTGKSVRGAHTKTCSRKCSVEKSIKMNKEYHRKNSQSD